MDSQTSDIIWVGLKRSYFFVGIVIEYAKLEVVRTSNEPVFSRDESDATNGNLSDFEGFDHCARFVVVNIDGSVVKAC